MVNLLKCLREKKAQADITFARIWSYSDLVFVKVFIIEGGLEHDHKGNENLGMIDQFSFSLGRVKVNSAPFSKFAAWMVPP